MAHNQSTPRVKNAADLLRRRYFRGSIISFALVTHATAVASKGEREVGALYCYRSVVAERDRENVRARTFLFPADPALDFVPVASPDSGDSPKSSTESSMMAPSSGDEPGRKTNHDTLHI